VCWFEEVNKDSVALVGGKCSSLGELINAGVRVPPGFALTTHGYAQFMRDAGIQSEITPCSRASITRTWTSWRKPRASSAR
jgi:pyruvate,water dikinase